ncbi:hypothetical protein ACLOJK_031780 [Asimina triloba]
MGKTAQLHFYNWTNPSSKVSVASSRLSSFRLGNLFRFPAFSKHLPILLRTCLSMGLDDHIERVLWTEQEISDRVSQLASQISEDFKGCQSPPVMVGVATGAFLFLADVVRQIKLPVAVDFVRVESYGSGTESSGAPLISCDVKIDIGGKHVILVEDIIDTGHTLSCLISHLESKGACSISVCTFLDKPSRRKVHFKLVGEGRLYRGFECPDYFVVGYGMDFAELYRNLPYVGVLKPELYKLAS